MRPVVVLGVAVLAGTILSIPILGLAGAPWLDGLYWIPLFTAWVTASWR